MGTPAKIILILTCLWTIPALMLTGFSGLESSARVRIISILCVWSPHILMAVSYLLQQQGRASWPVIYLPLLPFAIFLIAQPVMLGWTILKSAGLAPNSHYDAVYALEKTLPAGSLTTKAKYYSLRTIQLNPEKTIHLLALKEPYRSIIDIFGGEEWKTIDTGRRGVGFMVVDSVKGAPPVIHRSSFIESGSISENDFSNVGFNAKRTENGSPEFELHVWSEKLSIHFVLSLDTENSGLIHVKSASTSRVNIQTGEKITLEFKGKEIGPLFRLEELDVPIKKIQDQLIDQMKARIPEDP